MAAQPRPPIVTIMGHVDHGKTSLLDTIRHSSVAAKESGGITQHIGAYQVEQHGKKITFIDTPGHAAFAKMRSRGAQATDIVVLVVAATEGVKPQTVESIQHIKAAGVPYIVAFTKMDLPEANPEMVKAQLTEHEVFVEGYGGDVVAVPVSARSGEGIDKLLEMILLVAEMAELSGDPDGALDAVVIESKKDPHRGALATVLVKNGTLRVGEVIHVDSLVTETAEAKIRSMQDYTGAQVQTASLSMPVEVSGWSSVPVVGSKILSGKVDAPQSNAELSLQAKNATMLAQTALESGQQKILLILRADAAGTLEAIDQSMTNEVEIIAKGVGEITENDVLLAEATGARIIGFRVKAPSSVLKLAETHGVKIKQYSIIYELLEELQKQILKLIEPTIDEEELGTAEIVATFDIRGDKIAGCKVKSGVIEKTQLYHLKRGDKIVADPKISSLKRGKEDIESAKVGTECGIVFRRFSEFQIGDVVVAYRKKED